MVHVGFTAHMLRRLRDHPVLLPSNLTGLPEDRILGGANAVTAELLEECLQRLRCWVVVVLDGLRAEMPSWELVQSFTVFDLGSGNLKQAPRPDSAVTTRKLARLAAFAKVSPGALSKEYGQLLPRAWCCHQENQRESNVNAWRHAHAHHCKRFGRDSLQALRTVLCRYVAFHGMTTQTQESAFSTQQRLLTAQRNHCTAAAELDELKIALAFRSRIACPSQPPRKCTA